MQILNELSDITYRNLDMASLELSPGSWEEFSRHFSYQFGDLELSLGKIQKHFSQDTQPIPPPELREGYYNNYTLAYWLSGLLDSLKIQRWGWQVPASKKISGRFLDLGCSTGRVLRHLGLLHPDLEPWGADLNRASVQWARKYLHPRNRFLHNSALPQLPFASESFEAISAFSVFSHIEQYEELWLLELRRLLKPGGILYLTLNTDSVWHEIAPGHVLYETMRPCDELSRHDFQKPMPKDKITFHAHNAFGVYQDVVVHSQAYVKNNWQPFFREMSLHPRGHDFQDVFVFRK